MRMVGNSRISSPGDFFVISLSKLLLVFNVLINMYHCRKTRTRAFKSPWITLDLKKRMHDRDLLKLINCFAFSSDVNDGWVSRGIVILSIANRIKPGK